MDLYHVVFDWFRTNAAPIWTEAYLLPIFGVKYYFISNLCSYSCFKFVQLHFNLIEMNFASLFHSTFYRSLEINRFMTAKIHDLISCIINGVLINEMFVKFLISIMFYYKCQCYVFLVCFWNVGVLDFQIVVHRNGFAITEIINRIFTLTLK